LPTDDFAVVAAALQRAELLTADFESVIARASADDFIFADPPYTVKHNVNGFLKYNETLFSWDDQIRLKKELASASRQAVKITLMNAYHESIRDLYSDFGRQKRLIRHSVLAAHSKYRVAITERMIANW